MGTRSGPKKPFAKRSLGQNFLVDQNVVDKIVGSLGDLTDSLVIEIGPGRGALTSLLVENAKFYSAIELDTVFANSLKSKLSDNENARVFEQDILNTDFSEIAAAFTGYEDVKIVANLPYNISTAVLEKLASTSIHFEQAILMFQKEVVARITARPGNKNRGYLSVITEASFDTEFLFDVSPRSFKPVPRVNSAVVRVVPRERIPITKTSEFRKCLSIGFSQKRKTLANNLKNMPEIEDGRAFVSSIGLDPKVRAEMVSLSEWIEIAGAIFPK